MTEAAHHPVVVELFRMLPPAGAEWPLEDRALWFEAMTAVLGLLYPLRGERVEIGFDHVVRTRLSIEELEAAGIGAGSFDAPAESRRPIVSDIQDMPGAAVTQPDSPRAAEPDAPAPEIKVGDIVTEPDGPLDGATVTHVFKSAVLPASPDVASLVAPVMSPSESIVIEPKGRAPAATAPRPAGIPTTYAMIQVVLDEKPGELTARDLVDEMAARWWPELEFKRVAPDISTWITKGRIARDADGKLTLTERGRKVQSLDLRKTEAPEPEKLPDSIRDMVDPFVRDAVEKAPTEPPPIRGVSAAATRFAEMRAASKPAPPQLKPVKPQPTGTNAFEYGGRTIMLSLKQHRILSKLKAAMGKGMLEGRHLADVAFAGEAAKASNSEMYLQEIMLQVNPGLATLGLEMLGVPTMPGSTRIAGYVLRGK